MTSHSTRFPIEIWCQILQHVLHQQRSDSPDQKECGNLHESTLLEHPHYNLAAFAIDQSSRYAAFQLASRGCLIVDLAIKGDQPNSENNFDIDGTLPLCKRCSIIDQRLIRTCEDILPILGITIGGQISPRSRTSLRLLGNQWNELLVQRFIWRLPLSRPFKTYAADQEGQSLTFQVKFRYPDRCNPFIKRYMLFAKPYERCVVDINGEVIDLSTHVIGDGRLDQNLSTLSENDPRGLVAGLDLIIWKSLHSRTSLPLSDRTLRMLTNLLKPIAMTSSANTARQQWLQLTFPALHVLTLTDLLQYLSARTASQSQSSSYVLL